MLFSIWVMIFHGFLFSQVQPSFVNLQAIEQSEKIKIQEQLNLSGYEQADEIYDQVVNQLLSGLYLDLKSSIGKLESNYLKMEYENTLILYEKNFNEFCLNQNIKSKEILKYEILKSHRQASAYYSICSQSSTMFKESVELFEGEESPQDYLIQGPKSFSTEVSRIHSFYSNTKIFSYKIEAKESYKKFIIYTQNDQPFIHIELDRSSQLLKILVQKIDQNTNFIVGKLKFSTRYSGANIKILVDFSNTTPSYMAFHGSHKSYISKLDFSVFLNAYFIQTLSSTYKNVFYVFEMQLPKASEAIIQQNNKELIEELIVLINKVKQGTDTSFVVIRLEQLLQAARKGDLLDQRNGD